jgi:hypothetical protein
MDLLEKFEKKPCSKMNYISNSEFICNLFDENFPIKKADAT